MSQFIKNLIAAGILFVSLMASLAFGYALTPNQETAQQPGAKPAIKIAIDDKKARFNLSHSFKILLPKVND